MNAIWINEYTTECDVPISIFYKAFFFLSGLEQNHADMSSLKFLGGEESFVKLNIHTSTYKC